MSKFIDVGSSTLNLNAVARLELKNAETRTYYVHVRDSAMLHEASRQAVVAALSVLVPVHQEVQIYTLSADHSENDLEPREVLFQYRGLATHIIAGPLATQSHNRYIAAGFSMMDADDYYDNALKAVVHCSDGACWAFHCGAEFNLGTDCAESAESHIKQWFRECLCENG